MSARLLLLVGVLFAGAAAMAAPGGELQRSAGTAGAPWLPVVADPVAPPPPDRLGVRLPGPPPAFLAGGGMAVPASSGREGSNHRAGFDLDPDGTPAPLDRPIPPAVASHRVDHAAGKPTRRLPLFASTIPPPLPT